MRSPNPLPGLIFLIIFIASLALAYASMGPESYVASVAIAVVGFIIASLLANAVKVADQWERVVVLRLGKFRGLEGPGLFFIVPILETVAYRIDTRVITSTFRAEQTMTRDTVPVDVDAVLFFKVVDPKTAALDVADYGSAINWAAQTALRDVIGKTLLADMLEGREKLSVELQRIIDARAKPWGIDVIAVELKDVRIPAALQDAMSMQAQAERERQARVILGDSERQVAELFNAAAKAYADNPTAFHLRAMNMLYEGLKRSNATIVIVPSTAVEFDAARGHADDGDGRQRHRPGAGQWRGRAGRGRRVRRAKRRFPRGRLIIVSALGDQKPSATAAGPARQGGVPAGPQGRIVWRLASTETPLEIHPPMENPDDEDAGHRGSEEQDMRPDGELAIAGANFVAGDSPARVFGYCRRRAFNAAQIRLRPVETETVE